MSSSNDKSLSKCFNEQELLEVE